MCASRGYGHGPVHGQYYGQKQSGTAGKSCLIVGLILGGIGFFFVFMCGVAGVFVYMAARKEVAKQEAYESEIYEAEASIERSALLYAGETPTSIEEALTFLTRSEPGWKQAAASWLANQRVIAGEKSRVGIALGQALQSGDAATRQAIMLALKKWHSPDLALLLSTSLRARDSLNAAKLELLAQYRNEATFEHIAKLLESDTDCEAAYQTLKEIGPTTIPYAARYLASTHGAADKFARKLLTDFDVDVDEALIKMYVEQVSTDGFNRGKAAESLAAMEFDPELQPIVVEALNRACLEEGFHRSSVLKALETWGDDSSSTAVRAILNSSGFDKAAALRTAAKLKDESVIPAVAAAMTELGSIGDDAVKALILFGKPAESESLKYVNHKDQRTRNRARQVVAALETPDELLVQQSIEDIKQGDLSQISAACKWVIRFDVTEQQSAELLKALEIATKDTNAFFNPEISAAYCAFATKDQVPMLGEMIKNDSHGRTFGPAFEAILRLSEPKEIASGTAGLLGDFFKGAKTVAILKEQGAKGEEVTLAALNLCDSKGMVNACKVLSTVGTEKSVRPLENLLKRATRARNNEVSSAARLAGQYIQNRIKESDPDRQSEVAR